MRDFIVLPGEREHDRYHDVIAAYRLDFNRPALFRALLALGLRAAEIRWHAVNPGWSMLCAF